MVPGSGLRERNSTGNSYFTLRYSLNIKTRSLGLQKTQRGVTPEIAMQLPEIQHGELKPLYFKRFNT